MNELYEDNKIESCNYKHINNSPNNNLNSNKMIICRNNPFDQRKYKIDEALTNKIQTEISKECPICFEFIKKSDPIMTYQCLHKFHFNCIQEWIDKGNSSDCILCGCNEFIILNPTSTKTNKKLDTYSNTTISSERYAIDIIPDTNQYDDLPNNQNTNRRNRNTSDKCDDFCNNCIIC